MFSEILENSQGTPVNINKLCHCLFFNKVADLRPKKDSGKRPETLAKEFSCEFSQFEFLIFFFFGGGGVNIVNPDKWT